MVRDGDTVVLGDADTNADVGYVVLCRRHHRAGRPYPPPPEAAWQPGNASLHAVT
jgi:thymidine kinase